MPHFRPGRASSASHLPSFSPSLASLLSYTGSVEVPEITTRLVVREGSLTNFFLSPEFKRIFYGRSEDPTEKTDLHYYTVQSRILAYRALGELGDPRPVTIHQITLLQALKQKGFREECMLKNGGDNYFFSADAENDLCLVKVRLLSVSEHGPVWEADAARFRDMHKVTLDEGSRFFSIDH